MELREYFLKTGIKRQVVADMLDISRKTLWAMERRLHNPSLTLAYAVVKITGGLVTYEDLLPINKKKIKNVKGLKDKKYPKTVLKEVIEE